ncbi:MAG: hypothetical protein ACYTF7_09895, partial [Planctomycetota bacterium]
MNHCSSSAFVYVLLALFYTPCASAQWLFSYDVTNERLVRINEITGEVLPVSDMTDAIPPGVGIASLSVHQGQLYFLGYEFEVQTWLFNVNALTGEIVSTTEVT